MTEACPATIYHAIGARTRVTDLVITPITVGAFAENAYLVVDAGTGRAIFVDPGAEGDRLTAAVQTANATLEAIWLTHAHVDR